MGPPAFAGGNAKFSKRSTANAAALQWGHRLSPVETFRAGATEAAVRLLQWGHRLSPVETVLVRGFSAPIVAASMGPPAFAGGNLM